MKTSFLTLLFAVGLSVVIRISGYSLDAGTWCAVGFASALSAWTLVSYGRAPRRLAFPNLNGKLHPVVPLGSAGDQRPDKRRADRLAA